MLLLLGLLIGAGLLGIGRLTRGLPLLPPGLVGRLRSRRERKPMSQSRQQLVIAIAVALGVLVVTRNLVFAVIAAAGLVLWPLITGGGKVERAELAKLEALAGWTEALRDLTEKGVGLESIIPKTLDTADDILVPPLRLLCRHLEVKVPLPEALSRFADEVNDPSADHVVAALALAARLRAGRLSDLLTALASSLREEMEQRTKIMRERNTVRREAAQVAVMSAGLVLLGSFLVAPDTSIEGDTGVAGVLLPVALAAAYLLVFARIRKLAEPEREQRFLSSSADVLEAASYRPRGVSL